MRDPAMASDPAGTDAYGLPTHPPCPFCDGHDTELMSPFGSALSVATFWCGRCHTAFEVVKWREGATPPRHRPEGETGRGGAGEHSGTPDR